MKTACAPGIWKKLSPIEQKLWNDFYETFMHPAELFHADWCGKKFKEQQEVTAHNMACQAVWLLKDKLLS